MKIFSLLMSSPHFVSPFLSSKAVSPKAVLPKVRCAFTLLEVMIATVILAVGISAALSAILNNNNFRRSLDENSMADLVLRQMAARLKTTPINQLGMVYPQPDKTYPTNAALTKARGWTLHLRATSSTNIPAASTSAPALAQPYTATTTYVAPFPPLIQQDLIDAGIMREPVPIDSMSLYVEYYNLSTITGLQNVGGSLIPVENGLIKRFTDIQDANPTSTPRQLWQTLVGTPGVASPSDSEANNIIMPSTFSLANVDAPGTTEQIRGAFNHGLVIRILISWRPGEITNQSSTVRRWRETVIVKRD